MKKIIVLLLCVMMTVSFFGCGGDTSSDAGGSTPSDAGTSTDVSEDDGEDAQVNLSEAVEGLSDGVDVPSYEIYELDETLFETYAFVPWVDGIEAVTSEGMISTNAHSVVLIRTNGADTEKMAKDIAENANMRKWICVGAEAGKVLYTDEYIVLIMTYEDLIDGITENFYKLVGDSEVNYLEVSNPEE